MILLCETWLNSDFYDSEFFDDRYIVHRSDRDKISTGLSKGGGCLIAVKKNLFSKRMSKWELHKEDIWLSIDHTNGDKSYFNVRYIEMNSNLEAYKKHFDKISEIFITSRPNDTFYMFGDYNLGDSIEWCEDD